MLVRALSILCFIQACVISAASKFVSSSDGTSIFANAVGNPKNPSLVLIHGVALSGTVFDNLVQDPRLLSRYYLVTYDLRGHGRSDKPTNASAYASNLFAADFAAVSSAFNLKSPVVVAWSYGATVFTDIFSNLPANSVSGLVSIAGLPFASVISQGVEAPISQAYFPNFFVEDDVETYVNAKVDFVNSLFNNPANVSTEIIWQWLGSAVTQFAPITAALFNREQDTTAFFAAGARGLPLLIVVGTNDKVELVDVPINATVPHFTNAQVHYVRGGSHALFFDNQTAFFDLLIPFVAGLQL